jgi:creatinine amidohydrolase
MNLRSYAVIALVFVGAQGVAGQQPQTRLLEELNWMEFARLVPESVNTVLLPVGILEAHGVANNGADITAPVEFSARLAPRINAFIAPVIPFGVAGSLDEFPGTFGISAAVFEEYAYESLIGLAANEFKNIVIVNGHGPNGGPLRSAAERVWRETDSRVIVVEWWSATADLVAQIYGTEGGHAGNNENGVILAIRPDLVHEELYTGPEMATGRPPGWTSFPAPSSVLLYKEGEGYPDFDVEKAQRYFAGVVDRLEDIITDVIAKWHVLEENGVR